MNLRIFNIALLLTVSLTLLKPTEVFAANSVLSFCAEEVPGIIEHFVKENPTAATAVIVALASVIIFKDVVVSGAKKAVKIVKKNPIVSLGASLLVAGAAYGIWDHYYNQEPDLIEKALSSVQGGVKFVSDKVSSSCSQVKDWYCSSFKKHFDHMTYESAQQARQVVDDTKKIIAK